MTKMNYEIKDAAPISPQSTFRFACSTSIFGRCPRPLRFTVLLLLLFCPAILTLVYIRHYGVNVPFWDQWTFLSETMQKYLTHTLTLHDLVKQHNEHRIFFPRLVMLGLGLATAYNTLSEMYFSWLCACGSAFVIFSIYRRTVGLSEAALAQFIPVMALLFSWRQFENWLLGIQIVYFMPVLAVLCSFALLQRSETFDRYFNGALATGVIASFSVMNGLLVWPIGLWQLWRNHQSHREQSNESGYYNYYKIGAWGLAGVVVCGLYLTGYSKPPYHPSLTYSIAHPRTALLYLLAALGSPLMVERYSAIGTGLLLICLGVISYAFKRAGRAPLASFWDALVLFALMSALMLVIGRAGFGIEQALSSRYTTFTILGVIGLYVRLLALASRRQMPDVFLYAVLVALIVQGIMISVSYGMDEGTAFQVKREKAAYILRTLPNQNELEDMRRRGDAQAAEFLFPGVRQVAEFLKQQKLSIFATNN